MNRRKTLAAAALAASSLLIGTSAIAGPCVSAPVATYTAAGFSCTVDGLSFSNIVVNTTVINGGSVTLRAIRLVVTRQSLEPDDRTITVTLPDGTTQSMTLTPDHGGRSSGTLPIAQMGLYRASNGPHTALAAAGPLNPVEFADVRATPERD